MNRARIVCSCNVVTDADVRTVFRQYPSINLDALRVGLNIGTRCGCCLKDDCGLIDVKFEHLIKELTKELRKG